MEIAGWDFVSRPWEKVETPHVSDCDLLPAERALMVWLGSASARQNVRVDYIGAETGVGPALVATGMHRTFKPAAEPMLRAFDDFLVPGEPYARQFIGDDLEVGTSYFHVFVKCVPAHLRAYIEPYVLPGSEEVLRDSSITPKVVIDSWSRTPARSELVQTALEGCAPGSLFVQRRAAFGWLPWIHLQAAWNSSALSPIALVGASQLWFVKDTIRRGGSAPYWAGLTCDEKLSLLSEFKSNTSDEYMAAMIEMSRILVLFLEQDPNMAINALQPENFKYWQVPFVSDQVKSMEKSLKSFGRAENFWAYQNNTYSKGEQRNLHAEHLS